MTRTCLDRMHDRPTLLPDRPETYPAGRVCEHPDCGTILSVYNESEHCGAHQPEPDNRYCGYLVLICRKCGETVAVTDRGKKPRRRCGACGAVR